MNKELIIINKLLNKEKVKLYFNDNFILGKESYKLMINRIEYYLFKYKDLNKLNDVLSLEEKFLINKLLGLEELKINKSIKLLLDNNNNNFYFNG